MEAEEFLPLTVNFTGDLYIRTEQGLEVIMWTEDEWLRTPDEVVPAIINALLLVYRNPEELIRMQMEHIEAQIKMEKRMG